MTEYVRDGAAIYRRSFEIIREEADLSRFPADLEPAVVRMIHASGTIDLAGDIVASPGAGSAGRAALAGGAPVLCDSLMVDHGITRARLPNGNSIITTLRDASTLALADAKHTTRSAAAVDGWLPHLDGAVVAIGNAPTALFRLLELLAAGAPRPALVIGVPVGFVGAAESKKALAEGDHAVPWLTVQGRRGGSAIAAAAVNALAAPPE